MKVSAWISPDAAQQARPAKTHDGDGKFCAPLFITDFLQPDLFAGLSETVANISNWVDSRCLLSDGKFAYVSLAEWNRAPAKLRRTKQLLARSLTQLVSASSTLPNEERQFLRAFFDFAIVGNELRTWLGEYLGITLDERVSCEFARYRRGDYLAPHTDFGNNRAVAVNLYLGDWEPGWGGRLGFHSSAGTQTFAPLPNSLSLIPIGPDYHHWVTRWRHSEGRETICIAYFAPR